MTERATFCRRYYVHQPFLGNLSYPSLTRRPAGTRRPCRPHQRSLTPIYRSEGSGAVRAGAEVDPTPCAGALDSTNSASGGENISLDEQRQRWVAELRALTGRRKHQAWDHQVLNPPPLLSDVAIILVRTKLPKTVGTVARACSSFECEDIRLVSPSCDPLQRTSRNASCGAQYLLHRIKYHEDLQEAMQDCSVAIAFSRWVPGTDTVFWSIADLMSSLPKPDAALSSQATSPKVALVFGREDTGLTEEEIRMCGKVCSIPLGRLQESLSLSHAVTIPLSRIFEERLASFGEKSRPWLLEQQRLEDDSG